jgi:hypothetical protein
VSIQGASFEDYRKRSGLNVYVTVAGDSPSGRGSIFIPKASLERSRDIEKALLDNWIATGTVSGYDRLPKRDA